jgi:hypothetical protein
VAKLVDPPHRVPTHFRDRITNRPREQRVVQRAQTVEQPEGVQTCHVVGGGLEQGTQITHRGASAALGTAGATQCRDASRWDA